MHRRTVIATTGFASIALVTSPTRAHDRRAFERARVSLLQAVEAAERSVGPGARAVEAEFEGHGERPGRWEVKVIAPDRLLEVQVDAETGQVLRTDNERLERFLRRLTHRDLAAAPVTIVQAVSAAEQRIIGARAVSAEIKRRDDRAVWEVELIGGERRHVVRINASDGAILTVRED